MDISYFLVFLYSFLILFRKDSISLFILQSCDIIDSLPISCIFATIYADHKSWLWSFQSVVGQSHCLSSSSGYSTFLACRNWPGSKWDLAEKWRLYSSRGTSMTKTKTSTNKKDNVNSEFSEDIASKNNGITYPHGFTAWVKIHKGGSSKNGQNIHSISSPVTR